MNTDELYTKLGISVESYARGFMLADYSGKRGEASYCGRSLEWRRQPVCSDPFATEADAVSAALADWRHFSLRALESLGRRTP